MSPTFAPIGGGGVPKATVTGTVGSPTVNNNARAGKTIYTFNGSGSITVGTAGTAEILVVGGGGAGPAASGTWGAGGGAGAVIYSTSGFLNAETHTVTVGGGSGNSQLGTVYYAPRGGTMPAFANTTEGNGFNAGSGGCGAGQQVYVNSPGRGLIGYDGAVQSNGGGGGGGGGNANAATAGSTNAKGIGGNGTVTNINGSSVTYGGGGGGSGNAAGGGSGGTGGGGNGAGAGGSPAANNGSSGTGGGGGGGFANTSGTNGGSGIVIVVVG